MSVEAQQAPTRRSFSKTVGDLFRQREMSVFGALVILIVFMSWASPYFLEPQNIFNVLRNMSTISIIAIGMTMVIITGGIDLSVGSVLAMCAMFTARIMVQFGVNPWIACLAGLTLGGLAGMVNGLIITKVQVTAFIATLGMMSIARGLTYLLASGLQGTVASNMPMRDAGLNFLGSGYIGPVPMPVIEMFVLVIIGSLFLANTVLGRQIYGVGSNEQASRLSGVDVDRVRLFCYMLCGLLAAFAGIITAGLLATAATNAGTGTELDVIAAAVIGGASLSGGEGTIYGAVIGAAIMAIIRNAFVLLGLPIYLQTVTIGVVIILAVAMDRLRGRRVAA